MKIEWKPKHFKLEIPQRFSIVALACVVAIQSPTVIPQLLKAIVK